MQLDLWARRSRTLVRMSFCDDSNCDLCPRMVDGEVLIVDSLYLILHRNGVGSGSESLPLPNSSVVHTLLTEFPGYASLLTKLLWVRNTDFFLFKKEEEEGRNNGSKGERTEEREEGRKEGIMKNWFEMLTPET